MIKHISWLQTPLFTVKKKKKGLTHTQRNNDIKHTKSADFHGIGLFVIHKVIQKVSQMK